MLATTLQFMGVMRELRRYHIRSELETFQQKRENSWELFTGCKDDRVMSLLQLLGIVMSVLGLQVENGHLMQVWSNKACTAKIITLNRTERSKEY